MLYSPDSLIVKTLEEIWQINLSFGKVLNNIFHTTATLVLKRYFLFL